MTARTGTAVPGRWSASTWATTSVSQHVAVASSRRSPKRTDRHPALTRDRVDFESTSQTPVRPTTT